MLERVVCLDCGSHWDLAIRDDCGVCGGTRHGLVPMNLADLEAEILVTSARLAWLFAARTQLALTTRHARVVDPRH